MQNPMPMFGRSLKALSAILEKAEAHCAAARIDPAVLIAARLYPDMLPFARQVIIATDTAKAAAARLTGTENPRYEDVEASFEELRARIAKTREYLASHSDAAFEGAEDRQIAFKAGPRELTFTGAQYLPVWAIPNFFFHVATAYNILRHNGVPIGKVDFLGG
jgi:uncharacterized protein